MLDDLTRLIYAGSPSARGLCACRAHVCSSCAEPIERARHARGTRGVARRALPRLRCSASLVGSDFLPRTPAQPGEQRACACSLSCSLAHMLALRYPLHRCTHMQTHSQAHTRRSALPSTLCTTRAHMRAHTRTHTHLHTHTHSHTHTQILFPMCRLYFSHLNLSDPDFWAGFTNKFWRNFKLNPKVWRS